MECPKKTVIVTKLDNVYDFSVTGKNNSFVGYNYQH